MNEDTWFMKMALEEAYKAYSVGEVPVGCVIVDENKGLIARGHNLKETKNHPCGHAEIITLNQAGEHIKSWRLVGSTVYVTLEPCLMCAHALIHARVKRLVFGAYDPKGGFLSLGYRLTSDNRLNHSYRVMGGVTQFDCGKILSQFFKERRKKYYNE